MIEQKLERIEQGMGCQHIRIIEEQVLHTDGHPAVLVTSYTQIQYESSRWRQPDGSYVGGEMKMREVLNARHLYRFPRARPFSLLGRQAVGQWGDKSLGEALADAYEPNPDPSTYMDYAAWEAAFQVAYSQS